MNQDHFTSVISNNYKCYCAISSLISQRNQLRIDREVNTTFLVAGIPKKLLVAISVVAVVAMCLRPVEAASIEHRQRDSMSKLTKDRTAAHRTRHHHRNATLSTKESSSHSNDDPYEKARAKIENRVAFMKHNFDDGRKNLTESKYYGSGMTDWLPKTNFVNIHFQYKRMSRKQLKPRRLVSTFN